MKKIITSCALLLALHSQVQASDLITQARANKDLDQEMLEDILAHQFTLQPDGSPQELRRVLDNCTHLCHAVAKCNLHRKSKLDEDQKLYKDYLQEITILLALGADPLAKQPKKASHIHGRTPLKLAEDDGHTEVIELLRKALENLLPNLK